MTVLKHSHSSAGTNIETRYFWVTIWENFRIISYERLIRVSSVNEHHNIPALYNSLNK
jgi:hypothetical protein